jgi:hypothetical protein
VQLIKSPANVIDRFGGLEVTASSTMLTSLSDAFHYLYSYEYECSEQLSSRIISSLVFEPLLQAFRDVFAGVNQRELLKKVAKDARKLLKMQNKDGGFGFWPGIKSSPYDYSDSASKENPSWPFISVRHPILAASPLLLFDADVALSGGGWCLFSAARGARHVPGREGPVPVRTAGHRQDAGLRQEPPGEQEGVAS